MAFSLPLAATQDRLWPKGLPAVLIGLGRYSVRQSSELVAASAHLPTECWDAVVYDDSHQECWDIQGASHEVMHAY